MKKLRRTSTESAVRRGDGLSAWRKSSHSNPSGACVEVAETADGVVAFRDSKRKEGPVMAVSRASAAAFTAAVARDEL
ncbi:DUF397 domain-containing protein [Streptomyces coffeae]|uniref:DUF397 domain-containing protein n=1 Tax=Streptomyces coffeae TaxID=621382 RepID=A0ABS1NH89_9ACTN|nr:DUF397 domain-containing protein [Streptomyces coffeae]MBL1099482.1 DUF397 domain-containing protein [Streptomyces coffeae]